MKKIIGLFFGLVLLLFAYNISSAAEGTFELRSTDTNTYKCFAATLQMQNLSYKLIFSCRNLLFPIDETIYSYILWGNLKDGGAPVKIGSIGLGRGEFGLKSSYTSLFVTVEQNPAVKAPAGKVVMKGSIKPVTFLEKETAPEETPEKVDNKDGTKSPTPTPESQKSSTRERILTGLKRAGLASGLALIAILGLVFVLTRPR